MKLKLHSAVDVITNSSTVIYTQATESVISSFKEIVNLLLSKYGDGSKTADDLFTFSLEWDSDRISNWRWRQVRNACESREKAESLYNEYEINNPSWWNDFEPDYDNPCDRYLKVVPNSNNGYISEEQNKISKLFEDMIKKYYKEARYDG